MPTRIIRDGILRSLRINALSRDAELFYRRLMNVVDDFGRYEAELSMLRSDVFPLRVDDVTTDQIAQWLEECMAGQNPLIILYTVNGKRYLQITKFGQRERTSKCPDPVEGVAATCGELRQNAASRARSTTTTTTTTTEPKPQPAAEVVEMRRPVQSEKSFQLAATVNGSGTVLPADSGFELWATAAWIIHPKKTDKIAAWRALKSVYLDPDKKRLFDQNHHLWCETEDWRKENGKYCPRLVMFIENDAYFSAPIAEDEYGYYEVPEL